MTRVKSLRERQVRAPVVLTRKFLGRMPDSFYRFLLSEYPLSIGMETTNICNANCSFCAYRHMKRKKSYMSDDIFRESLGFLSKLKGRAFNLTPTVGDPLVDPKLLHRIEAIRNAGIGNVFFYTNGIRLKNDLVESILRSGISRIAISTYIGEGENYRKYYGVDKYAQVMENVFVLARRNKELGSPVVLTLHLRVDDPKTQDFRSNRDFLKIAEYIEDENIHVLESYDTWGGVICESSIPSGSSLESVHSYGSRSECCSELYRRLHVFADGRVGCCVCCDLEAEIVIGRVGNDDPVTIWRGKTLKRIRSNFERGNLPRPCRNCSLYVPVSKFISTNRLEIFLSFFRNLAATRTIGRANRRKT